MKIVCTSYINTPGFNDPDAWLDRISFYTGILEELAKQHAVESIEQINYKGKHERKGVIYHFLNYKKRILFFPRRLHRYIQKLQPDIMIVNGLVFPLQVIQLRWMLGKKVKIIIVHRAEKPSAGRRKFLQRMADHYVDAYLFVSDEMGMEWVKHGIITHTKKIMEVMEASSIFHVMDRKEAMAATKAQGDPVFLWVGRFDANKDPLTVIKAFLLFIQYQPGAKLYMIYQTEDILQEVKALIVSDDKGMEAVRLVGKVPHHELQAWYNSAAFIISGSHYEGSGIAVCEAMSCGCMPIITNIKSFRKMTGPGKCGILYEPGNEKDLLAALLQTREMEMEKERARTLQQFREELSFEAIAGKINGVINTL